MKRLLWTRSILLCALVCGQVVFCTGKVNAQPPSRAEAIAQIAARFPNSDKPAEQIYDEARIWHIAKTFVKQFRNFELGALTGPIAEDRYRTVTKEAPAPVGAVNDGTTDSTSVQGPSGPGGSVSDTTGSVVVNESDSSRTITERVDRRSIFFSEGHTVTTTAERDYTEAERREIRKTFLSMFDNLPQDVRIVIDLKSIQYGGQTATVTAQWKYDIIGQPTRLSRPYQSRSPGSLTLQMLRVGNDWRVTDFRGLVNGLKTDVTSR